MKTAPFLLARLALAATLMTSAAAQAVPLVFTITGDSSANWTMDSMPVPAPEDIQVDDGYFTLRNMLVTFVGGTQSVDVSFYTTAGQGGLELRAPGASSAVLSATSSQLYTGTQANPVFAAQQFTMEQYLGTGTYTLTIAAVPEPATVASMLAGLALVGALVRQRKSRQA